MLPKHVLNFLYYFLLFYLMYYLFCNFCCPSTWANFKSVAPIPLIQTPHMVCPTIPKVYYASRPCCQWSMKGDCRILVGYHLKKILHCWQVTLEVVSDVVCRYHQLCALLTMMLVTKSEWWCLFECPLWRKTTAIPLHQSPQAGSLLLNEGFKKDCFWLAQAWAHSFDCISQNCRAQIMPLSITLQCDAFGKQICQLAWKKWESQIHSLQPWRVFQLMSATDNFGWHLFSFIIFMAKNSVTTDYLWWTIL